MGNDSARLDASAYAWARSLSKNHMQHPPLAFHFTDVFPALDSPESNDVNICLFAPPKEQKGADVILMLERIKSKKAQLSFYPIRPADYNRMQKEYGGYVALCRMNGRTRYREALNGYPKTSPVTLDAARLDTAAYHWAWEKAKNFPKNDTPKLDLEYSAKQLTQDDAAIVKANLYEPPADLEGAKILLMVEWPESKAVRVAFLPIDRESYDERKQAHAGLVSLLRINGRIRFLEACNVGQAMFPVD